MSRLKGSADLLEDRRRRALALLDEAFLINAVGRRIGCNPSSVMRWRDVRQHGGDSALQVRFSPGRPLKLAAGQRKRLVHLLLKGPMAQGYRTNLWATARIAKLVESQFGVCYHPDHIDRLLHSLDWTPQKPERRALERYEDQIERWKQKEWPSIKNAVRLGAHIVFANESGFLLIPNVVRTWAPQGETPTLRHRQSRRDKISVISGIFVNSKPFTHRVFSFLCSATQSG